MEQEEEENMCDGDPGRPSWLSTRVGRSASTTENDKKIIEYIKTFFVQEMVINL